MKKRNIAIFLIISILVILGIVKKIQNIYELARDMAPDYDVEKICGQLSR